MITVSDIEKLATLARIRITDEEKESVRSDIEHILEYVGQIKNLTSEDVVQGDFAVSNVMREDKVTHTTGEYTETLLAAAPSRSGNYFTVKKIL